MAGFEFGIHEIRPATFLRKVDAKIGEMVFGKPQPERLIETGLLQIDRTVVDVSEMVEPVWAWGGGLTSFGADVVLVHYSGEFFALNSPETIRKVDIVAPSNGREAYKVDYQALMASPEGSTVLLRGMDYLRYNDIHYLDTLNWRGFVISYTEWDADRHCGYNALARYEIESAIKSIDEITVNADDWNVFFKSQPCIPLKAKGVGFEGHMAGGRITVASPTTVYLASGDFGIDGIRSDGEATAQDPDSHYGKLLEVDIVTGQAKIISKGLRNSQGIAVLPDGRVVTAEHGMRGGDELNLHYQGANFGWPYETYGTTYGKQPLLGSLIVGQHKQYQKPLFSWVPSPAVSNLTVTNNFHEAWKGDILVASLKDASIFRLRLDGDRVVYAERIPVGSRVRYILEHTDGRLFLWTDEASIIILSGRDLYSLEDSVGEYLQTTTLDPDQRQEFLATIKQCAECHGFSSGESTRAPNIARVYGDDIASTSYPRYSDGLKSKTGRWTDATINSYLENPEKFSPGTTMPDPGLTDPAVIKTIVGYLSYLDAKP